MKRLRAWLGVFLIFLLGAACGAILTDGVLKQKARLLMNGGNAKVEDPIVTKLRHNLRLDAAQTAEVRQIVLDARHEIEAARQRIQPDVGEAITKGEEKVRAILRTEQTATFDKLVRESHEKWRTGK